MEPAMAVSLERGRIVADVNSAANSTQCLLEESKLMGSVAKNCLGLTV